MTVLAVTAFLSIVFISMIFFVQTTLIIEAEHKKKTELRKILIDEAQKIINLLNEDIDTREYDSPSDEIWGYIASNENLELFDAGSLLNPNWIDPQVFAHIDKKLFLPPKHLFKDPAQFGIQQLTQKWVDDGIQFDLVAAYQDFFEEEDIVNYMTPYTYFNINLCYELVTKKLCEMRTGDEDEAEQLRKAIGEKLLMQKVILDQENLEKWFQSLFGVDLLTLKEMYPLLNAVPVMNVHYVPQEILGALLTYPPFGVQNPASVEEQIISRRKPDENKKGLTTQELKTIIGTVSAYPGPRIFHYLGVITNFWEIKVHIGDSELRWIIARVPPLDKTEDPCYKIIEEDIRL